MKYWIMYNDSDKGTFTIYDEFIEENDLLADAYFRGKVDSYSRSSYYLLKVI